MSISKENVIDFDLKSRQQRSETITSQNGIYDEDINLSLIHNLREKNYAPIREKVDLMEPTDVKSERNIMNISNENQMFHIKI